MQMTKMNKRKKIVVSSIATIFLIFLYILIFTFSEQDGETSGGLSRMISEKCVEILNALIPGDFDLLDEELINTAAVFMNNDLNLAAAAKDLFVHRNTLVYRLDKIKKITGLDLRQFDHAIVFKIALMVKKYLKANPIKY